MEPTDQPSSQPPVPAGPPVGTGGAVCYRHPARPTRLSCSSCGRPICVDCTNQASVGQKCPECAAPTGRNRVIRARDVSPSGMLDNAPVVTTILAITVGIAFLAMVAPAFWRGELFPLLADSTARVAQGDWWRTVSAALLHDTGLLHVGFNMWALAVFGPTIERRAGSVPFLLMYLASAAAGGLLFQIVRDGDVAIGASGAIFGLFGAHLAAAFLARNTTAGRAGLRQLMPLLLINLFLPVIVPNIAWEAHIGGLAVGALIMVAWSKLAPLGRIAPSGEGGLSPNVARAIVAGAVLVASLGVVSFV